MDATTKTSACYSRKSKHSVVSGIWGDYFIGKDVDPNFIHSTHVKSLRP